MNMAITILGFGLSAMCLSAMVILVICGRLQCARIRQRHVLQTFQAGRRFLRGGPLPISYIRADASMNRALTSVECQVARSVHGMEPSVVASFPTIKYDQQFFTSTEDNLCAICLANYKEKEILLVLPGCGHAFHVSCIDLWLRQHSTCPVCRISLRCFPEWRQTVPPFVSYAARSHFFLEALPDCFFQQPSELQCTQEHSPHTSVSIDCVSVPVFTEIINLEPRKPLLRGSNGSMELACRGQLGDGQQFTESGSISSPRSVKDESKVFLPGTSDEDIRKT